MQKFTLTFIAIGLSSCQSMGLKVMKGTPTPTPKPGLTMGGSWVSGKVDVQSFWCEAKGGILTFGASGPTEEKGTELAMEKCKEMTKDCKPAGCKRNPM